MDDFNNCVRVLAVSPHDTDLAVLSHIFNHSAWTLLTARSVDEARSLLRDNSVDVVLSERCLPDGDWKAILSVAGEQEQPPQLVVLSKDGDELLWSEVLNLGAWDVLARPFQAQEVYRSIYAAWQHGAAAARRAARIRRHAASERMPAALAARA